MRELLTIGFGLVSILVFAQTSVNSVDVSTFNTAGQGDLYVDETGVYYIGLSDGSLKEIGIITTEGSGDKEQLVWDASENKWVNRIPLPQKMVEASRNQLYAAPNNGFANLPYPIVNVNVDNAYNSSTGVFIAPQTGLYKIKITNVYQPFTTNDNGLEVRILVDGNIELSLGNSSSPWNNNNNIQSTLTACTTVELNANQTVAIQVGNGLNFQVGLGGAQHKLEILRLR